MSVRVEHHDMGHRIGRRDYRPIAITTDGMLGRQRVPERLTASAATRPIAKMPTMSTVDSEENARRRDRRLEQRASELRDRFREECGARQVAGEPDAHRR